MKIFMFGLVAALAVGASFACAAELKSGLQPGDELPAFQVEKCAGAVHDGKKVGDSFCYRCMLGNKPVVMVFSRKADANLAALVKELDQALEKNADKKLSSFVNLLGKDGDELKSTAKQFATKNKIENVALVVPEDHQNGPEDYKINPEAEVTVLIYRKGTIEASHAYPAGKFDKKAVAEVMADTGKILD